MKVLCRENHWTVIDGQLVLGKPTKKHRELENRLLAVLTVRILRKAIKTLEEVDLIKSREQIVSRGIEKTPAYVRELMIQAIKDSAQLNYAEQTLVKRRWYSRKLKKAN